MIDDIRVLREEGFFYCIIGTYRYKTFINFVNH